MRLSVRPARQPLAGSTSVPGDKSVAHRWLILASTALGESRLVDLPPSLDVRSTALALAAIAPDLRPALEGFASATAARPDGPDPADPATPPAELRANAQGFASVARSSARLDCGNSGTTMRLLMGLSAGRPGPLTLDGDESLRRRPMERVAGPLREMGAKVSTTEGRPPVAVRGGALKGVSFASPVASAQVKGAVLLAAVQAEGETRVEEAAPMRDHTERALAALGAPVSVEGRTIRVGPCQHPGFEGRVPGDPSAAAFLATAAALVPGSRIEVAGVGLNPTRIAFLRHLARMGARVQMETDRHEVGEPVGSLSVAAADGLAGISLSADDVAEAIDEIPILAVAAAFAKGDSRFAGADELRVKESDRLSGVVNGIRAMGGEAAVEGDDLVVAGGGLRGGRPDALGDHRLVMAFAVAGLAAAGPTEIDGAEWAEVSYPGFVATLAALGAPAEEVP